MVDFLTERVKLLPKVALPASGQSKKSGWLSKAAAVLAAGLLLSACQGGIDSVFPKAERPIAPKLVKKMKAKGMTSSSPILIRIYKEENALEVWKQKDTGKYDLLETYEICKWSGQFGPKVKEGDRQAPEGFYNVGKAQMNPNSDYHLSFNIGYPNTYDRSHGRTGTHLMVHGACSSAGCYSMSDEYVEQIYALAREAMAGGQDYFQVQAFPFRLTAANLAKHAASPNFEFWKMLKEGYDHFELTRRPPKVDVCEKRYIFNRLAVEDKKFSASAACPPVTMPRKLLSAYSENLSKEKTEFEKALRREQARAKLKGTELASVNIDALSIVATGNEVLPPPTPEAPPPVIATPEPVVPETATPEVASVPAIDGNEEGAKKVDAAGQTSPEAGVVSAGLPSSEPASVPVGAASGGEVPVGLSAAENEARLNGTAVAPSAAAPVTVGYCDTRN